MEKSFAQEIGDRMIRDAHEVKEQLMTKARTPKARQALERVVGSMQRITAMLVAQSEPSDDMDIDAELDDSDVSDVDDGNEDESGDLDALHADDGDADPDHIAVDEMTDEDGEHGIIRLSQAESAVDLSMGDVLKMDIEEFEQFCDGVDLGGGETYKILFEYRKEMMARLQKAFSQSVN